MIEPNEINILPAMRLFLHWIWTCLIAMPFAMADVRFSDGTFENANWSGEIVDSRGTSNLAARQVLNGGKPGSYRQITHTLNQRIVTAHLQVSANYDPRASGAISTIDYSFDLSLQSDMPVAYWILLFQVGSYYINGASQVTPIGGAWQTFTRSNLRAADFTRTAGTGPLNLDFSRTGAPIRFGYQASNTSTGPTIVTISGIDNWSVVVHQINHCQSLAGNPGSLLR